jgi:lipopolysaccharide/colanic/teichoic acid biosynthesis glycosyltransferase
VNVRRLGSGTEKSPFALRPVWVSDRNVLEQETFHRMISLERKRTERSRKPFLLMLLDSDAGHPSNKDAKVLKDIVSMLVRTIRETDVIGWYKSNSAIGVMFTELAIDDRKAILSTMLARISSSLRDYLTAEQFNQIDISFHLFPDDWDCTTNEPPTNSTLYPDLTKRDDARKFFWVVKRAMDIVGGGIALVLFSPVFIILALIIKLTSRGPVFYCQQRVGQYGVPFVFYKFRSMYVDNDPSAHKQYVRQMIAGKADPRPCDGNGGGVYKLTRDSRITRIGAFLRKTSLDELPQLLNVLRGDMSLVGPRPPIPYEVAAYEIWHRRRVLEAKPGMTGLWQVNGRNRVQFDEMVRLDLVYANAWSPWLDIKILLRTPRAVLEGAH